MKKAWFTFLMLSLILACSKSETTADTDFLEPPYSSSPSDFAIIINSNDPLSIKLAEYYAKKRNLPAKNVVRIAFPPSKTQLSVDEFSKIKKSADRQIPAEVQFLVLAWGNTYRVGCASITAAFTYGYREELSNCAKTCDKTLYNTYSLYGYRPWDMFKIRPTMMLAATDFESGVKLIDRGQSADFSAANRKTTALLMRTTDKTRSAREVTFSKIEKEFKSQLNVKVIDANTAANQSDVMFYFTGLSRVQDIASINYLPGAVADHLTSFGGQLPNSTQMSALEWLQAGATASYGTVVEPCAHLEKFPDPYRLIKHYLAGATTIEAYWKSVRMPGQGVFIGDPMAKPFRKQHRP